MSKQQKWRLAFAIVFGVLGIADIIFAVIKPQFDWFRAGLGILFIIAGAMSARKVLNERINA
jgi:uncharacterized membrane protein HdeD (DUF308 family)